MKRTETQWENEVLRLETELEKNTKIGIELGRELERWRHGQQIEGDYVCPNSLDVMRLQEVIEKLKKSHKETELAAEDIRKKNCALLEQNKKLSKMVNPCGEVQLIADAAEAVEKIPADGLEEYVLKHRQYETIKCLAKELGIAILVMP
jgi:hypothetical protein